MARYLGPKAKLSRREGSDLLLKSARRSISDKVKFDSKPLHETASFPAWRRCIPLPHRQCGKGLRLARRKNPSVSFRIAFDESDDLDPPSVPRIWRATPFIGGNAGRPAEPDRRRS